MQESLTSWLSFIREPSLFSLLFNRYVSGTDYMSDAILGPRDMMEEN